MKGDVADILLSRCHCSQRPADYICVTGRYQVCPGVFKKNISTQQSTWMVLEDGGCVAVALKDGSSAVALGGGDGRRIKIAAARRTCNDGVGISVAEAEG